MKLAIFDVDGTLLDNLASEDACYAAALREGLGLAELDTSWNTYEHITDEGVAREAYRRAFGIEPAAEQVAQTVEHFLTLLADAHARNPLMPVAGAPELLAALPVNGWLPVLATGAWRRAAQFKLRVARLPVDTIPLATAEDGPARVAIARAAWSRAASDSAPFDRVVLVGDGLWDLATAHTLDVPFIGRAVGERAATLRAGGATTVLANYARIDTVLTAFETASIPRAG